MTSATTTMSLFSYRSLIWNFAQRDLKSRFKGTALGWAWSLLMPLSSLVIYGVVFGIMLRVKPERFADGRPGNFAVWLFTGLVVWQFFSGGVNTAIGSLIATGGLLKKIYFPSYAPVLGAMIAVGVQSLLEFGVTFAVLAIFTNVGWSWVLVPVWAVLFTVFISGISLALSILNVHFRDIAHIIAVLLQLLFYSTPIIIPLATIPATAHGLPLRALVEHNPLGVYVALFRELSYSLTAGTITQWVEAFAYAVIAVGLGWLVFVRMGRDLSEEI